MTVMSRENGMRWQQRLAFLIKLGDSRTNDTTRTNKRRDSELGGWWMFTFEVNIEVMRKL